MHRQTRRQSGFSMIELIIVMALLAITAAVAIPNYTGRLPDMRLRGAARDLKSDMMLAQQRAIRENGNVAVVFNPGADSYIIFLDDGAGGGTANDWLQNGTEVFIRSGTMPATVAMDLADFGGNGRVRFDGRGLPDAAGMVRLGNTKNTSRRMNLSITGRATIETSRDGGGTWHAH